MPLFSRDDLADFMQEDVTTEAAASVEQVVAGWLALAGVDVSETPARGSTIWSWAVELGAIAHANPSAKESVVTGGQQDRFGEAQARRRREILDEAGSGAGGGVASSSAPRGCFPDPSCYPDPARHRDYSRW